MLSNKNGENVRYFRKEEKEMDARIVKTKERIHDTIIELLRSRHLSEITVSALCKKTGINRNTFYSHYRTPLDVVEEISHRLIDELDGIAKTTTESPKICIAVCEYLYEKKDVFYVLSSPNCDNKYRDIAIARARNSALSRPRRFLWGDSDYYPEFVVGGCIFLLRRWVETGMKEDPREMGMTVYNFIKRCFA